MTASNGGNNAEAHLRTIYPELAAGGFTRVDGTIAFYVRVNSILRAHATKPTVLDVGAGRGLFLSDPVIFRRELRDLRRIAHVIGADTDPIVLHNKSLDEAHLIKADERLPFNDGSIDLILSDFTFEHISEPANLVHEFARVLRPGGWVCARTPNRNGFIGIGARIVPNRLHRTALLRLQPEKLPEDTYPTRYVLNTPRDLRHWFSPLGFDVIVYGQDSEPRYVGHSPLAARILRYMTLLTPKPFRAMLFVFLHKRDSVGAPGRPD